MLRILWTGLAASILAASVAQAGDGFGHDHCGYCTPTVQSKEVDKHCWEVRCKDVCIPAVTFPWEMAHGKKDGGVCGCAGKCGKVRSVRYLWQQKYKCEECKCEWNIEYGKGGKAPLDEMIDDLQPAEIDDPHTPQMEPAPVRAAQTPARGVLGLFSW